MQFIFEFFHGNIKKVAPKYSTFLSIFNMSTLSAKKNIGKWSEISDFIIVVYSCCSFLSNASRFVYDWYHALAKHNANKISCFLILFEIKQVHKKSSTIITSFFKMLFVVRISLKSDCHLLKKIFSLLQWNPFKNDEKCYLFRLKSSFRSHDV